MSNIKSESLIWLDNLAALEAQLQKTPSATHGQLADALNLKRPYVTLLLALQSVLDPAAIEKVRLAAKNGLTLSFNGAKTLIPLSKMTDPSGAVHSALDVVLSRRLATRHIEALVDGIVSGKPAESFDSKAKQRPKRNRRNSKKDNQKDPYRALLEHLTEIGVKVEDLESVYWKFVNYDWNFQKDGITGDLKTDKTEEFRTYAKTVLKEVGLTFQEDEIKN